MTDNITDKRCSVVFRGDIVMGKNLPEVKQKLKKIFKVDDARVNSLFIGKPVSLKTKLSLPEAEKYKAILEQVGIVVSIESAQDNEIKPAKNPLASNVIASVNEKSLKPKSPKESLGEPSADGWNLAPIGSLLQDKKVGVKQKEINVNVDHLSIAVQEGNLIKDNERMAAPRPAVNAALFDWELTPYGEALLKEAEKKKVQAVDVDTASLSVLENDGNLLKEAEKKKVQAVDIDTTSLSVLENEGNLLKEGEKKKVEDVNVDTSHLSLASDE